MATTRVAHPEWRDSHEGTNYPFSQTATMENTLGDVIYHGTFLDAMFYPVGGEKGGYLSAVIVTSDLVTLAFGDSGNTRRCTATFNRVAPPDELQVVDSSERSAGIIVSESIRLSVFGAWSTGEHLFAATDTPLVGRVWSPTPNIGVRGFQLEDGTIMTGDIWLVGDDGVILSCEDVEITDPCSDTDRILQVIRVDIVGDPLWRRKLCADPDLFESKKFLEQITFCKPASGDTPQRCFSCGPSELGDLKLTVGSNSEPKTILRVRTATEGLIVEAVGERLEDVQ